MEIDLNKVIQYSPDSLQSRSLMRSIMQDLYPNRTREMNILLDVYESGIPNKIRHDKSVNEEQYIQYIKKIIDDYALQEEYAVIALNAWIDICIGPDTSNKFKKLVNIVDYKKNTDKKESNFNTDPLFTQPIIVQPVIGNTSDYEVEYLENDFIKINKFIGFDTETLTIPNVINEKQVKSIGKFAFQGCKTAKKIIVPNGVEIIEAGAFKKCSLSEIELPNSIKALENNQGKNGDGCFSYCFNLDKVIIPNGIKEIEPYTFQSCNNLFYVTLPEGLTHIRNNAFENCCILTKIILNEGLRVIEDKAFYRITGSEIRILIPSTVSTIGKDIFGYPSKVTVLCYKGSEAMRYARSNGYNIEDAGTSSI